MKSHLNYNQGKNPKSSVIGTRFKRNYVELLQMIVPTGAETGAERRDYWKNNYRKYRRKHASFKGKEAGTIKNTMSA